MNLQEAVYGYLDSTRHLLKERTRLHYLEIARVYFCGKIGSTKLCKLKVEELNNFVIGLQDNLSFSTTSCVKGLLNRVLEYAFQVGLIKHKLRVDAKIKQGQASSKQSLTNSEIKRLENFIISKNRVYSFGVLICLYTGLRIGEVLALKWQDVDLKRKIIKVNSTTCDIFSCGKVYHIDDTPKTTKSLREIPVTGQVVMLLERLRAFQEGKSEFVVSRKSGKQVKVRSYQQSFSNLLSEIGLPHYGFHTLRHTFATRCYQNGMDLKTLSELLGHSTPTVTLNTYVHTSLEMKIKAIESVNKKIAKSG